MVELHWIYTAFAALTLTALFIGGVLFLTWGLKEATIEEAESMLFLNKRSATHIIEKCLQNKGEYITTDFLDSFSKDKICSVCGICVIEVGLKVKDLETGKEWAFDYEEATSGERKTEMFTNIKSGDEVHVGKIYVEI